MSSEISLWLKKIGILGIIATILYWAYLTQELLFILIVSGFMALLITPLVDSWKKYKIPEWLTIIIVYLGIITLAVVVIGTIIPIIINYISNVVTQLRDWATSAQQIFINEGIQWFKLPYYVENFIIYIFNDEKTINTIFDFIKQNIGTIQNFFTSQISSITSGGISIVTSIWNLLTTSMMIGITTFFIIIERNSIGQLFLNLTPNHLEGYIRKMYKKIQLVCISWIKATAILSFSIFALTYIGISLVEMIFGFKTESTFTLAIISGIMEFIPYIGPILSVIPAMIIGLGISWETTIILLIVYIIIQQTENNFLVPYVMSKNLDISPLFVFIVMLFWATLGGILGIIVAVPIAAVIKVFYIDYLERHNITVNEETPEKPKNHLKNFKDSLQTLKEKLKKSKQ